MDNENNLNLLMLQDAGEIKKNKGGRPKGSGDPCKCKVTLYLTHEEFDLLTEFAKTAWWTFSYSGAARHLTLSGLRQWVKKGKRKCDKI